MLHHSFCMLIHFFGSVQTRCKVSLCVLLQVFVWSTDKTRSSYWKVGLIGCAFALTVYRGYYMVAWRYEYYFRVAKQYFMNERSEWVKYCFCHEKIKVISSSRSVMFFLIYRQKDIDKIIDFYLPKSNNAMAQIYSTAKLL